MSKGKNPPPRKDGQAASTTLGGGPLRWCTRLIALVALLAALSLGASGCGGDDNGEPARIDAANGSAGGGDDSVEANGSEDGESASDGSRAGGTEESRGFSRVDKVDPVSLQEASKELKKLVESKAKRLRKGELKGSDVEELSQESVETFAAMVLSSMGFNKAKLKVSDAGRTVIVLIHPSQACTARPGDQRLIQSRIKRATEGIVRRVIVRVGKVSLRRYLKRSCAGRRLIDDGDEGKGTGKIVWQGTNAGTGKSLRGTPDFEIRAKRWTIEYESYGADFKVLLYKDGKLNNLAVDSRGRGAGKRVVEGPGLFALAIGGAGIWKVRVRDGT